MLRGMENFWWETNGGLWTLTKIQSSHDIANDPVVGIPLNEPKAGGQFHLARQDADFSRALATSTIQSVVPVQLRRKYVINTRNSVYELTKN